MAQKVGKIQGKFHFMNFSSSSGDFKLFEFKLLGSNVIAHSFNQEILAVMSQTGKVQTVLGLIEPSALGRTLTHEHIKMNYQSHYQKPKRASDLPKTVMGPPTLETLGWVRQNPYSHIFNLCLGEDPFEDVVKELYMFKNEGGSTVVECTTIGMMQDIEYLKNISMATGLNIIAGTGYYDDAAVSGVHKNTTVEHLAQVRN